MKDKIRPIYSELQGYLSQAPEIKNGHENIDDKSIWDQFHHAIDELNNLTNSKEYDYFRIDIQSSPGNFGEMGYWIGLSTYRTKLGGLISRLHAIYFADEQPPFSGMPGMVINTHQTQSQKQEQQQSVAVDIALLIAEKKSSYAEGTPERTFIDKCGEMLKTVSDINSIIGNIMALASATGVGIEFLKKLFGG